MLKNLLLVLSVLSAAQLGLPDFGGFEYSESEIGYCRKNRLENSFPSSTS